MRWTEMMMWNQTKEVNAETYLLKLYEKLVKPFKAVTIHPCMAWPFEVDYPKWEGEKEEPKTQLERLQQVVDGYIEPVPVDVEAGPLQCFDNMVLLVNEDGLMKDLEFNPVATLLVNNGQMPALTEAEGLGTTIVGSVVLMPRECLK